MKILVADDSRFARKMAKRALTPLEPEFVEAATGAEALAACKAEAPDVVLLDLNMPELTGFEVLEGMAAASLEPIVVIISAHVQPAAKARTMALGAAGFLPKPFDSAELRELVQTLTDERASASAEASPEPEGPCYEEDELDALAELVNVGMGRAAAALAELLGEYVELSLPCASSLTDLSTRLKQKTHDSCVVSQQAFFGDVHGEVVTIFRSDDIDSLRTMLSIENDDSGDRELALDVANILNGACLGSLARQLSARIQYCRPSLLAEQTSFDEVLDGWNQHAEHLAIEIFVHIECQQFNGQVLVILPPAVEPRVRAAIADLLVA